MPACLIDPADLEQLASSEKGSLQVTLYRSGQGLVPLKVCEDLDQARDDKMTELRSTIEHMKTMRDEYSIAYNEGLIDGRLKELRALGILSEEDVSTIEGEVAACVARLY